MSGTFAYLLLLVHLFSVGLTASLDQEGLAPPQLLIEELAGPVVTLTLTKFTWSFEDPNSKLVICTEEDDLGIGAGDEITLTLQTADDTITDYGNGTKDGDECVSFTTNSYLPLSPKVTTYKLAIITNYDDPESQIHKEGSAGFAMTVETSTFTCNSTIYRRVSGETDDPIVQSICSQNTGKTDENTCYIEGNKDPFCFNVEATSDASDDFQICLGNTNQYTEEDGSMVIDNLLYEDQNYGSAAISLSPLPESPTLFEAIFLSTNAPIQYCTIEAGECEIIPTYSHGTTTYDICTIAILADPSTAETTLLSITDLNANAYVDDNGLLQFRFVNLNPACQYSATIVDTAANAEETDLPTVNIDCTNVDAGHTCYGFLEAPETVDNKFLDIKFLAANGDAIEGTASNTIRVPYPALPTTAAPTQTPLQKS